MKRTSFVLFALLLTAALSVGTLAAGPDSEPGAAKNDILPGGAYVSDGAVSQTSVADGEKYQLAIEDEEVGEQDPAAVADGDADAGAPDQGMDALFQSWEKNGYPDDIGGVYFDSETGRLAVLLVNGSEARKEELRAMAGDPDLRFTDSAYSYNELLAVLDEITKEMSGGAEGLYGAGIGWISRDGDVVGFGESGKEFRVTVVVDESALDRYTEEFSARYGDKVYFEEGEMAILDSGMEIGAETLTGGTVKTGLGRALPGDILLLTGLAALGALLIFLFLRRGRLVARTTTGETVTASRSMSRRAVEEAVKESAPSPSDEAYEKLMDRLK